MTNDAGMTQDVVDALVEAWYTPPNPERSFDLYDYDGDGSFSTSDAENMLSTSHLYHLFYPGLYDSASGAAAEITEYFSLAEELGHASGTGDDATQDIE